MVCLILSRAEPGQEIGTVVADRQEIDFESGFGRRGRQKVRHARFAVNLACRPRRRRNRECGIHAGQRDFDYGGQRCRGSLGLGIRSVSLKANTES